HGIRAGGGRCASRAAPAVWPVTRPAGHRGPPAPGLRPAVLGGCRGVQLGCGMIGLATLGGRPTVAGPRRTWTGFPCSVVGCPEPSTGTHDGRRVGQVEGGPTRRPRTGAGSSPAEDQPASPQLRSRLSSSDCGAMSVGASPRKTKVALPITCWSEKFRAVCQLYGGVNVSPSTYSVELQFCSIRVNVPEPLTVTEVSPGCRCQSTPPP